LELFLERSSKAFIELRYDYELPLKKGYGWMGMEISDCVRHVILELKPDWKDALTRYTPVSSLSRRSTLRVPCQPRHRG